MFTFFSPSTQGGGRDGVTHGGRDNVADRNESGFCDRIKVININLTSSPCLRCAAVMINCLRRCDENVNLITNPSEKKLTAPTSSCLFLQFLPGCFLCCVTVHIDHIISDLLFSSERARRRSTEGGFTTLFSLFFEQRRGGGTTLYHYVMLLVSIRERCNAPLFSFA